jgi:HNH endonuclease
MEAIVRVLKLDISGIPESWITLEHAVGYYATGAVAYTLGDAMRTLRGGHNCDGDRSAVTVHSIIAVNGTSAAARLLSALPRLTRANYKLFRRDRHTCAYCGGVFREAALEREHVIPTSRGGTDTWTNVVSACRACNQLKAAKTPEEARMPLLYVPYVPSRWEDMILQARADHIVADQMAFLRESLPKGSRLI